MSGKKQKPMDFSEARAIVAKLREDEKFFEEKLSTCRSMKRKLISLAKKPGVEL